MVVLFFLPGVASSLHSGHGGVFGLLLALLAGDCQGSAVGQVPPHCFLGRGSHLCYLQFRLLGCAVGLQQFSQPGGEHRGYFSEVLILLVALLLEVGYFLELVQRALLVLLHQAVDFISSAGILCVCLSAKHALGLGRDPVESGFHPVAELAGGEGVGLGLGAEGGVLLPLEVVAVQVLLDLLEVVASPGLLVLLLDADHFLREFGFVLLLELAGVADVLEEVLDRDEGLQHLHVPEFFIEFVLLGGGLQLQSFLHVEPVLLDLVFGSLGGGGVL